MRCRKTDKFPRGYDLCFFPKSRKMFLIAGHQIVRTRSVRAFQEYIVRGISCYFKPPGRDHCMTVVLATPPVTPRSLTVLVRIEGAIDAFLVENSHAPN